MIKAVAKSDAGETMVLLGLSDRNMELLKAGKPIVIEMWELGFTGKLAIVGGGTEDELADMFKQNIDIDELVDERSPKGGH